MDPISFVVVGDPSNAVATVGSSLSTLGYKVEPSPDGWSGRASVGSAAARALAGGFTRRMVVGYLVSQGPSPEVFHVVITPAVSGWSGGALGASKAKKELEKIRAAVGGAFQQQGILRA